MYLCTLWSREFFFELCMLRRGYISVGAGANIFFRYNLEAEAGS